MVMVSQSTQPGNARASGSLVDERGAIANVTGQVVASAVRLVTRGLMYSLSVPIQPYDEFAGKFRYGTSILKTRDGGDFEKGTMMPNSLISSHRDYLLSSIHGTTTHIDALAHIAVDGKLFGGVSASAVRTDGARQHDIAQLPYLVTRGVVLDVAACRNVSQLAGGTVISRPDIEACLKRQDVELASGDAILLRTGWITRRTTDPAGFVESAPGIGREAAAFLGDAGVCLVGADTWLIDAFPFDGSEGGDVLPAHQELVYRRGCYLLKLLNLEEVVQARLTTFLLAIAPLKIKGACGSPVNPLAIA